jgi:cell fate regulator YaaT (PSP1 superfamily)
MSFCSNCNTCGVSLARGSSNSSVFNWLEGIDTLGNYEEELVEVRFKQDRKEYYSNPDKISIKKGDIVAVEGNSGHDIGVVTLLGDLVALQIKRKKITFKKDKIKKIYRITQQLDIEKWEKAIAKEKDTLEKAKLIVLDHKLEMKLSNVEYQGDNTKAIFYYTADKRVDFRELIKSFSRKFMIRIEMRQIGARQEAAKLGGIGSCGRELCCSAWMTEFPSVSTSAARYKQLAISPQKISGQCGRLKCCLNFELDSYLEALKNFPSTKTILKTKKDKAKSFKIDIFKRKMWFVYMNNSFTIIELSLKSVKEIIKLNKEGKLPEKLEDFVEEKQSKRVDFDNVIGQSNLARFDKKTKKRKKNKKRAKNKRRN